MSEVSRSVKNELVNSIRPVLNKIGFDKCQIDTCGTSKKGDGYVGDINFITASGFLKTGEPKTCNFVLKCGKKSAALRKQLPVRAAFENEIAFYNDVIPEFTKYQKEKNIIAPFNNVPKCYKTNIIEDMEMLVLDDMRRRDFYLWDRTKPMDRQHVEAVLKTYAKFHAISFNMRDHQPDRFKNITKHIRNVFKLFDDAFPSDAAKYDFNEVIRLARENCKFDILKKAVEIDKNSRIIMEKFHHIDEYSTIIHGDCWNNNFMFKKTINDEINVCLLDWQMVRLGSPVLDLSYFLFTCVSEEEIQTFDQMLNFYYQHFCNFLLKLGSDPNVLFPHGIFMKHWSIYGSFGIILMPTILKVSLSEEDEAIDLCQITESGQDLSKALHYNMKNIKEYQKRTFAIMKFSIERKFI